MRLSLDSRNVQHEKLVFQLVEPYIKGFSAEAIAPNVKTVEAADAEMSDLPPVKKTKKEKQKKNKK